MLEETVNRHRKSAIRPDILGDSIAGVFATVNRANDQIEEKIDKIKNGVSLKQPEKQYFTDTVDQVLGEADHAVKLLSGGVLREDARIEYESAKFFISLNQVVYFIKQRRHFLDFIYKYTKMFSSSNLIGNVYELELKTAAD